MNIERDVLDRLTQLAIRFYVTGSWALSVYAAPDSRLATAGAATAK